MANLIITSTTKSIRINLGDDSSTFGGHKCAYPKSSVSLLCKPNFIQFNVFGQNILDVSNEGSQGIYKVDLVDGVAPASFGDLFDKLQELLG